MSDTTIAIVVAAVAAVIILLLVFALLRSRRRTHDLQERFGPEYERTLGDADSRRDRRAAQSDLAERAEERDRLEIRPLGAGSRERFAARWTETQAMFVDAPASALGQAETLLDQVLAERGYPTEGFEEQSRLVSVDHPQLVENYRIAHAVRDQGSTTGADTEAMRNAMLAYRSLFDELLAPDAETRV